MLRLGGLDYSAIAALVNITQTVALQHHSSGLNWLARLATKWDNWETWSEIQRLAQSRSSEDSVMAAAPVGEFFPALPPASRLWHNGGAGGAAARPCDDRRRGTCSKPGRAAN
ncbi:MAG: hypothetical protein NTZ05_14455 [Chloroflexi bacterium]|nr:hypothetical protein [Chloroflexota bacterium]